MSGVGRKVYPLRAWRGPPAGRSAGEPHRNPGPLQLRLQLPRIRHAKMKNTSRKRRICLALAEDINKMPSSSRAA